MSVFLTYHNLRNDFGTMTRTKARRWASTADCVGCTAGQPVRAIIKWVKPKFHLARQVRSDTTHVRHVERVETSMSSRAVRQARHGQNAWARRVRHFGCVELVEQYGSTRSTRRARLARHVQRVVSRHAVTSRLKLRLIPVLPWLKASNRIVSGA